MPFFEQPESKGNTTPFDKKCAKKLHKCVVEKMRIRRAVSHEKWAQEFRILRKETSDDKKLIKKRLKWFIRHWDEKGVPPIRSAQGFRRHFHEWLADAIKRWEKHQPVENITPEAEKMATRLARDCKWPKGSRDQLPGVVQQCFNNITKLFKQLKEVEAKTKDGRIKRFIPVLRSKLFGQEFFTSAWMSRVYNKIKDWEDWSGDLKSYVFTPTHKMFQSIGKEAAQSYSGSTIPFELLMEVLNGDD